MKTILATLFAAALGLAAATADDKTAPNTPRAGDKALKLEGTYTFKRGEEAGQPIPPERLQGAVVTITTDEMVGMDTKKNQLFVAKYTLDSSATPAKVKMKSTVPAAGDATGLVERRGEELWLIYNLPGGEAPTSFETKGKQQLFVLVRQDGNKGAANK